MKLLGVFFFILFVGSIAAQHLNMDTIFVNEKVTSYIILPKEVDMVDVGSPKSYGTQFQENSVFLKATGPNKELSTLLIKCGKEYYFGIIKYSLQNQNFMYDLKSTIPTRDNTSFTASPGQKSNTIEINNTEQDTSVYAGVIPRFLKLTAEVSTLGFLTPFMDAAVTVIRNDKDKTYLKFIVKNKTSLPYKLDFISFQYYQDHQKGDISKSKKVATDVFPLYSPNIKEVAPLKTIGLGYVIPAFALANKGYLLVMFREEKGDRVLKIKISNDFLLKCRELEPWIKNGQ